MLAQRIEKETVGAQPPASCWHWVWLIVARVSPQQVGG